ncbi:MAG: M48 family metallopeptidase [Gammaproteobacteria bacterium]|nr:M48 family metallopeptidase [Gammaproteobacteria bacterium]
MDFFAQQDLARRNTRLLTLLFVAAVFLLVAMTNAAVAAFLYFSQQYSIYSGTSASGGFLSYFTWARFGAIGFAITCTVAIVVMVKWMQLSAGGKAVAESMGGSRIVPQTRDRAEMRCLNVVEEMALAANMPVPPVYVLNDERGINAFAAGVTPADAVIGVTRGTIAHLKRHELQGVIAHEFSHILNGDMRLNIRLAAMLKGITFIGDIGHFLLRSGYRGSGYSTRSNAGAIMPLLGLALWAMGWLGGMLAGFIKAAISRQKEYLADASAVQYTRSPDGIADALKVIGGYIPGTLVHAARAIDMSHIFFGQIQHRLWQVFATHPPLRTRIRRLDKHWNGEFITRRAQEYAAEPSRPGHGSVGVGRAALVTAAIASAAEFDAITDADFGPETQALDSITAQRQDIPLVLVQNSHDPLGAQALVLSLLVNAQTALAEVQLQIVDEVGVQGLRDTVALLYPQVQQLGPPLRLPLLEMSIPALKAISPRQYRTFKTTCLRLIKADKRTELHEWCLFQLLRHYLDSEFVRVAPSTARHRKLTRVRDELRVALSVMAYEANERPAEQFSLGASELGFNDMQILPADQATVVAFSRAVNELANCYPLLKPRVLKALVRTATGDGTLSPAEKEIIASIAAVMDCPVPDVEKL